MDFNMNTIPLFRSSGATRIEGRWSPSDSWVRTKIHNAIRRAYSFFFLRPWNRVEVAWKRWNHGKSSDLQSESGRRVPDNRMAHRLRWTWAILSTGLPLKFKRNARRLEAAGTLPLDSLPPAETEEGEYPNPDRAIS